MATTESTPLSSAMQTALAVRKKLTVPTPDLIQPAPSSAADLFSNDYLSVTTNPTVRQMFLERIVKEPLVFGSAGSRLLTGNKSSHVKFEERMRAYFEWPAALLFNSGYDANLSFFHAVPQDGDAIIFDELVHASIRDGISASRCRNTQYPFKHNSVASFREAVARVLAAHPNIAAGKGTVFIAVETLYSMDGDFCPLKQVIEATEELVPKGSYHIMVDEAHTSGLFGNGRGLVPELGLKDRVQSVVHTFSKVWGMSGGMCLISSRALRALLADPLPVRSRFPNLGSHAPLHYWIRPPHDLLHFPPILAHLCTEYNMGLRDRPCGHAGEPTPHREARLP